MSYVARRAGFFVVTLWAALSINFFIPRMMPGNPALTLLSRYEARGHLGPGALNALEVAFGLNKHQGLLTQYWQYLGNSVTGNFGISYTFFPDSVSHEILQALPWTIGLVGVTTVIAFVLGTLIGVVSAWFRGGRLDSALPPLFVIISGFPYFWIALLCVLLFGVTLGWLPVSGGYDVTLIPGLNGAFVLSILQHSVLPALTIVVTSIGGWILTMRNNMITVVAEDYVRMARAKGLPRWKIMWGYAGRNAMMPNLTGFGISLGFVISGAVLVEYVFNYPGLGWMLLDAVSNQDYPLMQALFLLITVAVMVAVLAVDLMTLWLDPRTRENH
ncbi:MAG: ABC transporter permease [Acidimicrobiales bacterium]